MLRDPRPDRPLRRRRDAGGRPGEPRPAGRRRAGGARSVRVGQVHAAARGRRSGGGRRRLGAVRRRRPGRRTHPPARLRADVPGRPAVPAPVGRRQRRLPAAAAAHPGRERWRARVDGAARARRAPGLRRAQHRPASPAASGSGSRWPGRWPSSRGCCCSTSRCPPSTAGLRERLAHDLRDILVAAGTTALLVTHDQEEAFAVADRMALMRAGRLVRRGHRRRGLAAPGRRGGGPVPRLRHGARGAGGAGACWTRPAPPTGRRRGRAAPVRPARGRRGAAARPGAVGAVDPRRRPADGGRRRGG